MMNLYGPGCPSHFGHSAATFLALVSAAFLTAGCSRRPTAAAWPEPRPLAAEHASPARPLQDSVPPQGADHGPAGDRPAEPTGSLTLEDALALALQRNPSLAACAQEVAAEEARAVQAGLWRNPEVDFRRDRLWATEDEDGEKDEPRTRVILSQVLELTGAPARRRAVGQAESDLAAWDCEAERLQVAAEVLHAFATVLGEEAKLAELQEARNYVEEVQRDVVARVAAGQMPKRRLDQMTRHAGTAEIAVQRGEADLAAARVRLAATWGGSAARFGRLVGRLEELPALPDTARVRAAVDSNPAVARWGSEIALAGASAALARAEVWPEVRLDAGMRREDHTEVRSYLLGLELPLPIFDRAQGERSAARHDLAAAQARQAAARAEVSVDVMAAYQDLAAAHFAARTLREKVIPAAENELAALKNGYAEEAVSVADLLDGARDLTRARLDYVDALIGCHQALADLEGLTGLALAPGNP